MNRATLAYIAITGMIATLVLITCIIRYMGVWGIVLMLLSGAGSFAGNYLINLYRLEVWKNEANDGKAGRKI